MINKTRLAERFRHMQTLTAPGKGINRLAFTDADWEGRAYLTSLMKEAGLSIHVDAFGNVIGHRKGADDSLPAVMCGSHGDSVPEGGNYDGVTGILGAIEVAQSMEDDHFQNERPFEVVLFMSEESSRFSRATLGSRAMRGEISDDDLHTYKDKQGESLYDVLKGRGLDPDHLADAVYKKPLAAFFEIHIEQGKVLEHEGLQIGVVTGIAAPTRLRLHLHGSADHSGATPMNLRHDGLAAASEIILSVEKEASAHKDPPVVGTVGTIQIHPNAMNVVPGEVEIGIDMRSIDKKAKEDTVAAILNDAEEITKRRGISFDVEHLSDETPVPLRKEMVHFLESCCEENGYTYKAMPSGAGHDAMHWADYTPTGMLFLPCKNGVSHNPAEYADMDDITHTVKTLETAIRKATEKSWKLEAMKN